MRLPSLDSRLGILFPTIMAEKIIEFQGKTPKHLADIQYQPKIHQQFIQTFFAEEYPFQSLLLYHGLGTGKTCTSLFTYDSLFTMSEDWNVYIIIKKSLEKTWKNAFDTCLRNNSQKIIANIKFVSYDAYNVGEKFDQYLVEANSKNRNLFVIDEVHNFVSRAANNLLYAKYKKRTPTLSVYRKIQNLLKSNSRNRILAITATPAINEPYELCILFNLLKPGIFPENYTEFNDTFVNPKGGIIPERYGTFQRRVLDLVSFVMPSDPNAFAQKIEFQPIRVPMSEYQQKFYLKYQKIEKERKRWAGETERGEGTFNIFTRQACNFIFPDIDDKINANSRRAPGTKFNSAIIGELSNADKKRILKEEITFNFFDGGLSGLSKKQLKSLKLNEKMMKAFVDALDKYWDNLNKNTDHTVLGDLQTFDLYYQKHSNLPEYDRVAKFIDSGKIKSKTVLSMLMCSRKMLHITLQCRQSPGIAIVYSSWVRGEGLQIFSLYLHHLQITPGSLDPSGNPPDGSVRYLRFTGDLSIDKRNQAQVIVNDSSNLKGTRVKILLISAAGSEGIDIMNCRQVHLMEPYWHEVRMQQVIGRGIRRNSHLLLPKNERNVTVFRYLSTVNVMIDTLDQMIHESSKIKHRNVSDFLGAIREAAIDCQLFQKANALHPDIESYRCFDFSDEKKLRNEKGTAYRKVLAEDILLEVSNEIVQTITTKLIKGSYDNKIKDLLLDETEGYVYDTRTHKLFGTIQKDFLNLPIMHDIGIWTIKTLL